MANKPKFAVGDCVAGLFNDAVSSCGYTASNVKLFSEKWIGNSVEGSSYRL